MCTCMHACVCVYVGGVGVCARLTECEYTHNVCVCVVNADTSNREKAAFRVEEAEMDAEWAWEAKTVRVRTQEAEQSEPWQQKTWSPSSRSLLRLDAARCPLS